jgi:hypothetical protein
MNTLVINSTDAYTACQLTAESPSDSHLHGGGGLGVGFLLPARSPFPKQHLPPNTPQPRGNDRFEQAQLIASGQDVHHEPPTPPRPLIRYAQRPRDLGPRGPRLTGVCVASRLTLLSCRGRKAAPLALV